MAILRHTGAGPPAPRPARPRGACPLPWARVGRVGLSEAQGSKPLRVLKTGVETVWGRRIGRIYNRHIEHGIEEERFLLIYILRLHTVHTRRCEIYLWQLSNPAAQCFKFFFKKSDRSWGAYHSKKTILRVNRKTRVLRRRPTEP